MTAFRDRLMAATLGAPAEGAVTLVAVSGGSERLGCVHAHPGRDAVTDDPCGHVAIVALEAEAEGLGAAGKLMARPADWARARSHRLIGLDVFATDRRVLDFYARGGFRPETVRSVKPLQGLEDRHAAPRRRSAASEERRGVACCHAGRR